MSSSGGPRSGGITSRARAFGVALLLVCAGLATQVGAAQANDTLKFTFNEGRINLGDQKGLHMIDSAVPDPPAVLTVSYDQVTGNFSWPGYGVQIPSKTFQNVPAGLLTVDVIATFEGAGDITGNYNKDTGVLDTTALPVTARISIYQQGQAGNESALYSRCRISPVPLLIDSTGSLVNDTMNNGGPATYNADVFEPTEREGAGVTTWTDLPNSVFEAGAGNFCTQVDDLVDGPGGIWLSGSAAITLGEPTPPAPPGGGGGTTPPATTPATPPAQGVAGVKCKKGQKLKKGKCVKKKKKKKK